MTSDRSKVYYYCTVFIGLQTQLFLQQNASAQVSSSQLSQQKMKLVIQADVVTHFLTHTPACCLLPPFCTHMTSPARCTFLTPQAAHLSSAVKHVHTDTKQ